MNKIKLLAVVPLFGAVLMGASKCGTETNVTCSIISRNTLTITTSCVDNHGNHVRDEKHNDPSDLYPKCQVGAFYPACKEK